MSYSDIATAFIATAVFTVLFLVAYKYIVNPQVVLNVTKAQCPDRWSYNAATHMCEPHYTTHCTPFNPDAATLQTASAKCNVAQSCGSFWAGYCP